MRCWDCDNLIVTPEIIDGEVGVAGQIRANQRKGADGFPPRVVTQEFHCNRCGTIYSQTTARKPGKATTVTEPRRRKDDYK